ncbi:MAG: hypothetical protein ACF8R7_16860 [Phycisphaerales bacterium JB039]
MRILLLVTALLAGGGAGGVGVVGIVGCASGPADSPRQAGSAAGGQASGDWDDVPAAIWTAAGQSELAVEQIRPGPDRLEATLRTVRSEPVTVTALRGEGGAIELEAKWGRFGDGRQQAAALVERIGRRLGQLEGRAWAPVR